MGIYVGGTAGAVLEHNDFGDLVEVAGGTCPKYPVVEAAGFAPGLQIDLPVHVDTALVSDNCVNPKLLRPRAGAWAPPGTSGAERPSSGPPGPH